MAQKVYVIKPPKNDRQGQTARAGGAEPGSRPRTGADSRPRTTLSAGERWARVLLAYLIGPLSLVLLSRSRFRYYLAGAGALMAAAAVYLLVDRSVFSTLVTSRENGVFVWAALLAAAALGAAAVWARAVSLSGRDAPPLASVSPNGMRHPFTVGALGLLLPGLGYVLKGHKRRAACVVWTAGLMVLALVVLAGRRGLWEEGRWAVSSGPAGLSLEVVFVCAAAIIAVTSLVWIVQALDGGRRFSAGVGRLARTDLAGLGLLLVLAIFVSTVRPASFGQSLAGVSSGFYNDGYRLVPLCLYEAAARLDPANPVHLANAAVLNEQLGMEDAARAKRVTLQRRMEQYEQVVGGTVGPDRITRGFSTVSGRPLPGFENEPQGDTVRRIRGLLRSEMSR